MKALVTGGAGFIGSHLARRLVKGGHEVTVIDRKEPEVAKTKIGDIWDQITYHHDDYSFADCAGVDAIFHLAAERSVPKGEDDPETFYKINVVHMRRLLEKALEHQVGRFVFSSSSSVYGGQQVDGKQNEQMDLLPQSHYAETKLMGEELVKLYARRGLPAVSLRYFNVFGPGQDLDNAYAVVVPKFITEAFAGKPIPVHWDGLQSRDFTFVDNVVDANLKAASVGTLRPGEAYNVSAGQAYTVKDLAERIVGLTGSSSEIVINGKQRQGDVRSTCGDPVKSRRDLGYRAHVSFEQGLERTVRYAREQIQAGRKPF